MSLNNKNTLIEFEKERYSTNYIPPEGSNSFYTVGDGEINLYVIRENSEDYRFNLFTHEGTIHTGSGIFYISGDISDTSKPYNDLTVINETELFIDDVININKGSMHVSGTVDIKSNGKIILRNNAEVIFYYDSIFNLSKDVDIDIEPGSSMTIYGQVNIDISVVDKLLSDKNIILDTAAVLNVSGLDQLGSRIFSLTDYYTELSNKIINTNTQGEKNYSNGRLVYTWIAGEPLKKSQLINMKVLYGTAILGDFKLSVLGLTDTTIDNLQIISDLFISENTTLYITENYNDQKYIHPELYLGIIIDNNSKPADCIINGTVIVDGENSKITLDRHATMHIGETGKIYLQNGAYIQSAYNEGTEVLYLEGELIIEDIEQISTFSSENIVFGEKGKITILNPDRGEKRVLFSTPNGIQNSELYRLFKGRLDHIEYHIQNNTGIEIDQYYEFYNRQMTDWYDGKRIEKVVFNKQIIWHDGGFINLRSDIIPWVNENCTLLKASRLFKSFESYDIDILPEVVNRLKYAGFGNILFRFINGRKIGEVMMHLEGIRMNSIINKPLTNTYQMKLSNDGDLFLRNKVYRADASCIIDYDSEHYQVIDKQVEFEL